MQNEDFKRINEQANQSCACVLEDLFFLLTLVLEDETLKIKCPIKKRKTEPLSHHSNVLRSSLEPSTVVQCSNLSTLNLCHEQVYVLGLPSSMLAHMHF